MLPSTTSTAISLRAARTHATEVLPSNWLKSHYESVPEPLGFGADFCLRKARLQCDLIALGLHNSLVTIRSVLVILCANFDFYPLLSAAW